LEFQFRNKKKIESLELAEFRRRQKEIQLDIDKRTPPDLNFELIVLDSSFQLLVKFNNSIPIKLFFRIYDFSEKPRGAIGIPLGKHFETIYPNQHKLWRFKGEKISYYQDPEDRISEFKLRIEYLSIYYDEMNDDSLFKVIVRKYSFNWDTLEVKEIK
jgi:hypothetical protein